MSKKDGKTFLINYNYKIIIIFYSLKETIVAESVVVIKRLLQLNVIINDGKIFQN